MIIEEVRMNHAEQLYQVRNRTLDLSKEIEQYEVGLRGLETIYTTVQSLCYIIKQNQKLHHNQAHTLLACNSIDRIIALSNQVNSDFAQKFAINKSTLYNIYSGNNQDAKPTSPQRSKQQSI